MRRERSDVARTVALRGREGGATAELGDDVAGCLRGAQGGGDKPYVLCFSSKDHAADASEGLAPTLRAMGHSGSHANAGGQLAVCVTGDITHTLKAEGFDASEDGTGRGQPIIAVASNAETVQGMSHAHAKETNAVEALRALQEAVGAETYAQWALAVLAALREAEILRSEMHGSGLLDEAVQGTKLVDDAQGSPEASSSGAVQSLWNAARLGRAPQGWRPPEQLAAELGAYLSELPQQGAQAARFLHYLRRADEGLGLLRHALSEVQEARGPAHGEGEPVRLSASYVVRRLTVRECCALQGFPDDYLSQVIMNKKPLADGPMYKALGNSMAVPVMRWIGEQIEAVSLFQ